MSVRIMSQVWENSRQKGGKLLTLLAIADFANDDGLAWPSIETLQKKTRMSRRCVQNAIRELVETGEVIIQENAGPNGVHLYQVGVQILHCAKSAPVQKSTSGGAKSAQGGRNLRHARKGQGGAESAPNPSIDPSIDPSGDPSSSSGAESAPANDDGRTQAIRDVFENLTGTLATYETIREMVEGNASIDMIKACAQVVHKRQCQGQDIKYPWRYLSSMVDDAMRKGKRPADFAGGRNGDKKYTREDYQSGVCPKCGASPCMCDRVKRFQSEHVAEAAGA